MLLSSFGIDPTEMRQNVEGFMVTMKTAAERINANQARLEAGQARLEDKLDFIQRLIEQPGETVKLTDESGQDTGILLTSEKFPQELLKDAGIIQGEASDGRR